MIEITSEPGVKVSRTQDTRAERLLCTLCETRISKYERSGLRILRGGAGFSKSEMGLFFGNFSYEQFKLFATSLIWRASVASREYFTRVRLPDDVRETARLSLQSGTALNPPELGIKLSRIIDSTPSGGFDQETLKDFVALPVVRQISPIRHVVLMIMEGFVLEFYVPKARPSTQRERGFVNQSKIQHVPYLCVFKIPEMVEMLKAGMDKHMNGLVTFES